MQHFAILLFWAFFRGFIFSVFLSCYNKEVKLLLYRFQEAKSIVLQAYDIKNYLVGQINIVTCPDRNAE